MSSFLSLIENKREGRKHSPEELRFLVEGFATGSLPDYQGAAWLMAAYLRGLDPDETLWLTEAMVRSGRVVDLSPISGVKVDKHSTGGVADTTTLAVGPMVAACGVPVAKMSGRGLGHTGGTLDKLESIPGFSVDMSPERFERQVAEIGLAIVAQSDDVAPADRAMYALRDVTGTVPSMPLIVGSVVSKKIAGGADAILLDVKCGAGAFMRTAEESAVLADELVRVGTALGRRFEAVITDMNVPLGSAIGNALEVREAVEVLAGKGGARLTELAVDLCARMLVLGGVADGRDAGRRMARASIDDGSALAKMAEWVAAQGGDPTITDDPGVLPLAKVRAVLAADRDGFVSSVAADAVGRVAVALGAGRARKGDPVDASAGVLLMARMGDPVRRGDPLAEVHGSDPRAVEEAVRALSAAMPVGDDAVTEPPLFVRG